ncbi:hypothetical protein PV328_010448 [Microctonus aethiopoides]|uniref:Nucleoprotein n=1 Tax=Microctonus aethiopoides TaxID=144406 RepID=A0AA39KQA3_9HYME|nr:hypothetical protein PV328_010448 [Microctonus aethiopoides]
MNSEIIDTIEHSPTGAMQENPREALQENPKVTMQKNAKETTQENPREAIHENQETATQKMPIPDPDFGGWNDELLAELDGKCRFSMAVTSRESFKNIIARFYQAYFNNIIDPKDNLAAVVLDAIGIAAYSRELLWTDDPEPSMSSYPENASVHTELNIARNLNPAAYVKGRCSSQMATHTADDTPLFEDYIVMLFNKIPASPTDISSEEFHLRSLTGFLAMTMLRAAVKTETQLINSFNKEGYAKNLHVLSEWPAHYKFVPPAKEFIKTCCKKLTKETQGVTIGFTKLAALFTRVISSSEIINPLGYISAAVLKHTEMSGLGLLQMVDNISRRFDTKIFRIMELIKFEECFAGWVNISVFFEVYLSEGKVERGWNWARIIDEKYIRGLTPKDHPWFGILLLSIISCCDGPGVWKAGWCRKFIAIHDDAKQLGIAIFRRLCMRDRGQAMCAGMAALDVHLDDLEEIPDIQALYHSLRAARR